MGVYLVLDLTEFSIMKNGLFCVLVKLQVQEDLVLHA